MRKLLPYLLVAFAASLCFACTKTKPTPPSEAEATLRLLVGLQGEHYSLARADDPLPSVEDITLEVWQGSELKESFAPIGSAQVELSLAAGEYTLKAYTQKFSVPAFDMPVYGVEKEITLTAGETLSSELVCTMSNAGVKVRYSDEFLQNYTTYTTTITQGGHSLAYEGADALRTGYFLADYISVQVETPAGVYSSTLQLLPRHIYTLTIRDQQLNPSIKVSVDTGYDEQEIEMEYTPGGSDSGSDGGNSGGGNSGGGNSGGGSGNGGGSGGDDPQDGDAQLTTLWQESVGSSAVETDQLVSAFEGWQSTALSYAGSGMRVQSQVSSSGYTGASAGNSLLFKSAALQFVVDGIDVSGATSLELSFGAYLSTGSEIDLTDLALSASVDGGTPTVIPLTKSAASGWVVIQSDGAIPTGNRLKLTLQSSDANLYVDDFLLSGMK